MASPLCPPQRGGGFVGCQAVADAEHGLDELSRNAHLVELATQIADVAVHRALYALVAVPQADFNHLRAGQGVTGTFGQRPQEADLGGREMQLLALHLDSVGVDVHQQPSGADEVGRGQPTLGAAQDGPDARDQLARMEGLGDVVVGP